MRKRAGLVGWVGLGLLSSCSSSEPPAPVPSSLASSPQAAAFLTSLRTRFVLPPVAPPQRPEGLPSDLAEPEPASRTLFPHGSSEGFDRSGDRLTPRLRIASSVKRPAAVTLPVRANGGFEVKDSTSGLRIAVKLRGTTSAEAEEAEGNVVYRGGFRGQGAVVHRPHAEGTEDFVLLEHEPEAHALVYEVDLRGVAGLRLTSNVLEFLNAAGDPRLRMTAPLAMDAEGKALGLRLSVRGCAVDEKEALPWGREVVRPGAERCEVRVEWEGATYPLVVDPGFTTTGSLAVGRSGSTVSALSGDRVLVIGGSALNAANCPGNYCKLAEVWQNGSFAGAGSLAVGRDSHTASLLSNDRVLVVGGRNGSDTANCPGVNSYCKPAEVWQNGSFSNTGSLIVGRAGHTTSVLSGDRVLVVGGSGNDATNCPGNFCKLAERWQNGSFSNSGNLTVGRSNHTVSVLSSDRVLVVGGSGNDATNCPNGPCKLAEQWQNGSFSNSGNLTVGRFNHTASVLSSDRVLVIGGSNSATNPAELWQNGSFTSAGTLAEAHSPHTASVLSGDRVLVVGGSGCSNIYCKTAELWQNGAFSNAGSLAVGRTFHTASVLSGDRVLIVGGYGNDLTNCPGASGSCKPAELWQNGSFAVSGSLAAGRAQHTASVLSGDQVLVVGGYNGSPLNASELWDIAASDQGKLCSGNLQCSSGFCVDQRCCDKSCTDSNTSCILFKTGLPDGTCGPIKNGTPCSNGDGSKCGSGFCSDGRCCDKPCDGICESCIASTKGYGVDGVCEPIQANSDPQSECSVQGGGICQSTGFCDGSKAACESKLGTTCLPASCSNSTTQLNASTCDATGNCVSNGTTPCAPYFCVGSACASSCSSDDDCQSPAKCIGGKCGDGKDNGQACSLDSECKFNHCVDGICCDDACNNPCFSCKASENTLGQGKCSAVLAGTDPGDKCPAGAPPCGADGLCDGSGQCNKNAPGGTTCGQTSCVGQDVLGQVCDGNGACTNAASPVECTNGYKCQSGVCPASCGADGDCKGGFYCKQGKCTPTAPDGASCSKDSQCENGHCVEGVCCNTACLEACSSCIGNKTGDKDGVCKPASQGQPDPKGSCPVDANECGADGSCNGSGVGLQACSKNAPDTKLCGAPGCDDTGEFKKVCDGFGGCKKQVLNICAGYACDVVTNACKKSCADEADCASTHTCQGGQCAAKLGDGEACQKSTDCGSGFCADGVCCDAPCQGQCESCAQSGALGQCKPTPAGQQPAGSRIQCNTSTDAECHGACDGGDPSSCKFPGTATLCSSTSCDNNTLKPFVCDGSGACKAQPSQDCGTFACDPKASSCKTSCASNDDCAAGATCNKATTQCSLGEASCVDDFTAKTASGTLVPCKGRCLAGQCQESCGGPADCAKGYSCQNNTCVQDSNGAGGQGGTGGGGGQSGAGTGGTGPSGNTSEPAEEGGCGCAVPGAARGTGGAGVVLLVGLLGARRRRRCA